MFDNEFFICRSIVVIIYIHGFGSCGEGSKAKKFRKYFKKEEIDFIAPSLSYVPSLALKTLEELIESYTDVSLIGSSLGGFYAIYLCEKYNLKSVLINPSIFPYQTLNSCLGNVQSYCDESYFRWTVNHINMLKICDVQRVTESNYFLLVQKDDETLDYKEATKKFLQSKSIIEEAGSHSFDGIEKHFEKILSFLTYS